VKICVYGIMKFAIDMQNTKIKLEKIGHNVIVINDKQKGV